MSKITLPLFQGQLVSIAIRLEYLQADAAL